MPALKKATKKTAVKKVAITKALAQEISQKAHKALVPAQVDPLVRLTTEELAELERPRAVVTAALETGSLDEVFAYGKLLGKVGNVVGLNKAQLVFLLREKWTEFQGKGAVQDDFENVIEAQFGLTPANTKKYADAWDTLIAKRRIPDKFVGAWMHKPVESWLAIKAAAADGLPVKKWEEATIARKPADVKKVVRAVRGGRTSAASRLIIQKRRKTGELRAWKGNSKPVVVGALRDSEEDLKDPVRKAAYDRIIAAAGILVE